MAHTFAKLDINSILVDEKFQNRVGLNKATVADYQLAVEQGATLPPIDVYTIDGQFYVVDGFHRLEAQKKIGCTTVDAIIREGNKDDAHHAAIIANQTHGLPRTPEDKRMAVLRAINDSVYGQKSDNEIARLLGVSQPFVSKIRAAKTPDRPLHKFTRRSLKKQELNNPEVITLLPQASELGLSVAPKPKDPRTHPELDQDHEKEMAQEAIKFLIEENDKLRFELAVGLSDDPDFAKNHITELENELRTTKRELDTVTNSRNFYMAENAQLKRQIAYHQRQLKKANKNISSTAVS